ncbi:unnamed protein product [Bursaphelenchus xylophilus]|uniref:(pine wood nematode) hypothetical protein n=1 Tax=Bursaphelenchus xylophilus TaxID=6326 RepID=A0A1I7SCD9_BURXY|nr:unnamed protein product [Bursaphelenchus xylophilus]CAG9094276.1 unnamed protein product [Bursaphelenchus xylophilus]
MNRYTVGLPWLILFTFLQLSFIVIAGYLYSTVNFDVVFRAQNFEIECAFVLITSVLLLFNFHQVCALRRFSIGFWEKRTGILIITLSGLMAILFLVVFFARLLLFPTDVINTFALLGSSSYGVIWLGAVMQYYMIYDYVDAMVTAHSDVGIPLSKEDARELCRLRTYESMFMNGKSKLSRWIGVNYFAQAEYYFLMRVVDGLERSYYSTDSGKRELVEILEGIKLRLKAFNLSEMDCYKFEKLARKFPHLISPSSDPYYEYDRRVIGNGFCTNSKYAIFGTQTFQNGRDYTII